MDTRRASRGLRARTRARPGSSRWATLGVIPIDAIAVALNVTVTQPTMPSYLTVWPAGVGTPTASNLNFEPGQTVANMVTVGLGPASTVSLFNLAGTVDVIVDVDGLVRLRLPPGRTGSDHGHPGRPVWLEDARR